MFTVSRCIGPGRSRERGIRELSSRSHGTWRELPICISTGHEFASITQGEGRLQVRRSPAAAADPVLIY